MPRATGPDAGEKAQRKVESGRKRLIVSVILGSILVQSSHLVHPVLGPTHRFHLGVGNPAASVR